MTPRGAQAPRRKTSASTLPGMPQQRRPRREQNGCWRRTGASTSGSITARLFSECFVFALKAACTSLPSAAPKLSCPWPSHSRHLRVRVRHAVCDVGSTSTTPALAIHLHLFVFRSHSHSGGSPEPRSAALARLVVWSCSCLALSTASRPIGDAARHDRDCRSAKTCPGVCLRSTHLGLIRQ